MSVEQSVTILCNNGRCRGRAGVDGGYDIVANRLCKGDGRLAALPSIGEYFSSSRMQSFAPLHTYLPLCLARSSHLRPNKHHRWPVQVNGVYSFDPSGLSFWVGPRVSMTTRHAMMQHAILSQGANSQQHHHQVYHCLAQAQALDPTGTNPRTHG